MTKKKYRDASNAGPAGRRCVSVRMRPRRLSYKNHWRKSFQWELRVGRLSDGHCNDSNGFVTLQTCILSKT